MVFFRETKDRPIMDGLLVAAAPYSIARRGAAAPRLKHELSHIFDTTSSSIEWHEIGLLRVSHGRYNLSNEKEFAYPPEPN
jgi:hypothetical protein